MTNESTNWVEFFNAFGTFCALIIASLTAAWIRIQNRRLSEVKTETAAAKQHAETAAETLKESREERGQQFASMEGKAEAAFEHANNTNDKIERQQSEILSLRRQFTELIARVAPVVNPPPDPPTGDGNPPRP